MLPSLRSALFWSTLMVLTRERLEALLHVYGSLAEAMLHLDEALLRGLACTDRLIGRVLKERHSVDIEGQAQELEEKGIQLITFGDEDYPARLADLPDAPPFLYAQGDLSILLQPCVSLVGTRQMSLYGKRITQEFVPELVRAGMVTVSGLAHGIDALVAEETMALCGKTVAVLGHGLSMIQPRAKEAFAKKIVQTGGLLLSEFPLHYPPDVFTFPMRNRIVAGLGLATVVIEAPAESGALITAGLAHGYGRDVFAVPGQIFDPTFAGCHELLVSKKALIARSARDILQEVGIVSSTVAHSHFSPRSDAEAAVFKFLTTMPQPVDDLMLQSGLPPGALSATLTMMELAGGARNVGGGLWVRS